MRQPSLFSVQARAPAVDDLAGLLCGPGQALGFGRGVAGRVSVVVADPWRAAEIARACRERGLPIEEGTSDEGAPLVRTAFVADLVPLAAAWARGAVKAVPRGWQLDGPALRLWAVAAGTGGDRGYALALDPHAPGTHEPLAAALATAGLAGTLLGARAGGPAVRVAGRRRVARLAELVGDRPAGAPGADWPA